MRARPIESDELRHFDYLAQHGARLLDNGYHIVPIRQGGKSPSFDGWEKSKPSKDQLREWLANGHKQSGVGILTKHTPAIDIDILDDDVATLMETYVRDKLGGTLMRIGKAPKRLFVFRTDDPFRKRRTTVREDDFGQKQQIEVLCEGQQFVAYHKHPDTGRPYYWPDEMLNPLEVRQADLPELTQEHIDGLFEYFEEVADKEGWEVKKAARTNARALPTGDAMFEEDTAPVDMSDDEIFGQLMLTPGADDYDTWFQVGMALYHQWDGGETGLKFWHEWSETADNYDREALESKWDTFKIDGKRRAPVTVRTILKMAKEAVEKTRIEEGQRLRTMMAACTTIGEWEKARKEIQHAEIDNLTRGGLVGVAKERRDAITGTKTPLQDIRRALAYVYEAPKGEKVPSWVRNWVYDTSDDRFYDVERKISATMQGFDAMYNREAFTKKDLVDGAAAPTEPAHGLALNFFKVKTVQGRRYEPGQDDIYYTTEGVFANTYTEKELPEIPEKKLPRDQKNVQRIQAHIKHLLRDEREQRMFLDWISWIVQNPGKHVNYAILLQGVEGDGKSFFAEMMREVMGMSNVTMLNAHIFESDFTDWTVGQCLSCIEETRIVKATNKFEVINRIKPFITNRIIEVHPKGKPVYNAKNTSSYLLFSNYKDALPLDDDGRRYLVLFSQWQRKTEIGRFKAEHPDYYEKLYQAIEVSAGAIRQWLLAHEQADDFNPMGDAPTTAARTFMIKQSKPQFIQELDEMISEHEHLCADQHLLNVSDLPELFMAKGYDWPAPKAMAAMLQRDGYEDLGRIRLDIDSRARFWSKTPEMFRGADGNEWAQDNNLIKDYIKRRTRELDSDDDEL